MNVLVTGGTGFIGHNVVLDLLMQTDWDFTVVDCHDYAGAPEKLIEDLRYDASRVQIVTWNLTESLEYVKLRRPDIILNLASNSHVDASIEDPVPFIQNNVGLQLTMLEFARVMQPKLFIHFSTDEVYGPTPSGGGFKEWSTILPSNPYSASKAAQEAIAISYWRTYCVPLVITNTMNVLGPHQYPEKFLPKIVEHLIAGHPVPIHAERQDDSLSDILGPKWVAGSRFYTYVSNISSALKFLVERAERQGVVLYPKADRPERFNIVGNREVCNDEMVDLVAAILGVESLKEYVDYHQERPGHDRRYALDGSALKAEGWVPPVSFEEGLRITVEDTLRRAEVIG